MEAREILKIISLFHTKLHLHDLYSIFINPDFFQRYFKQPKFECKTNAMPILMHQMRISTNQVSSVVFRPKKLEIRKTKLSKL
jgi:hypothetical protein